MVFVNDLLSVYDIDDIKKIILQTLIKIAKQKTNFAIKLFSCKSRGRFDIDLINIITRLIVV